MQYQRLKYTYIPSRNTNNTTSEFNKSKPDKIKQKMRHEHVKSRLSEIINRLQNTTNGTTFSASQTDLTAKILYSTTANHSNHLKRPNFQKKNQIIQHQLPLPSHKMRLTILGD